jgi:hypothetical protein
MVRRRRRWVSGLMMLSVLFAQFVTAAHACPLLLLQVSAPVESAIQAVAPDVDAMPADCADASKEPVLGANVCEAHCGSGMQLDIQAQTLEAALAPQPALTVHVADVGVSMASIDAQLSALVAAPPRSLLFSRFLI